MPRSGVSDLPLHNGDAPKWLFYRMVKMASAISDTMIEEYGTEELLTRLSNPFWFQALSCVLGFDWHSSGTTTVTCGAIKEALKGSPEVGVGGGKGATSNKTPSEIGIWCETNGLSWQRERDMVYASRMAAKVDSAALQDGHQLYHHCLFFDRRGHWSVVQQGMNGTTGYARRYQWSSACLDGFVVEPHAAILGARMEEALDMTARQSEEARKVSVDLINDGVDHLEREIVVVEKGQSTLSEWAGERPMRLSMPRTINWTAMRHAYEFQPANYEELLAIEGVGPSTVRALALIGELVHGTKVSWKDPVKFSFAVGGKDGVPYPVDRTAMDRATEILKAGVEAAKLGDKEKMAAIDRLRRFIPPDLER
jgi:hypothetical protein